MSLRNEHENIAEEADPCSSVGRIQCPTIEGKCSLSRICKVLIVQSDCVAERKSDFTPMHNRPAGVVHIAAVFLLSYWRPVTAKRAGSCNPMITISTLSSPDLY